MRRWMALLAVFATFTLVLPACDQGYDLPTGSSGGSVGSGGSGGSGGGTVAQSCTPKSPNYLNAVTPLHLNLRSYGVKFYISPEFTTTKTDFFGRTFDYHIETELTPFQGFSDDRNGFRFVDGRSLVPVRVFSLSDADIVFHLSPNPPPCASRETDLSRLRGCTEYDFGSTQGVVDVSHIYLYTTGDIWFLGASWDLTIRHEWMHALGLLGHSGSREDLLYPNVDAIQPANLGFSGADLNTVMFAYCPSVVKP